MGCFGDYRCCSGWHGNQYTAIPIGYRSYMERNSIRRVEECWKRSQTGWCIPKKGAAGRWIHYAQFSIEWNQRSIPRNARRQKYSQHYQFLSVYVIHANRKIRNVITNYFEMLRFCCCIGYQSTMIIFFVVLLFLSNDSVYFVVKTTQWLEVKLRNV